MFVEKKQMATKCKFWIPIIFLWEVDVVGKGYANKQNVHVLL